MNVQKHVEVAQLNVYANCDAKSVLNLINSELIEEKTTINMEALIY